MSQAEQTVPLDEREAAFLQASLAGVVTTLDAGSVVDFSSGAEQLFGYPRDLVVGRPLADLVIPPGLRTRYQRCLARCVQSAEGPLLTRRIEVAALRADGSEFPAEVTLARLAVPGTVRFIGFIRDLTESKAALRDPEARKYQAIFENAVEGFFQTSPEGRFLTVNPALARMYGCASPEDVIAHYDDIASRLYVDPNRRQEFIRQMAERGVVTGFEFQIRRRDDSRLWISESAREVRDAAGNLLYYEGTVEDIDERKKAQEALAEREERLRTILESEPECVKLLDAHGRLLEVNPAGLAMIEADSPQQVIGRCVYPLVIEEHRAAFVELSRRVFGGESGMLEFELVGLKGGHRWLETHASPLRGRDGKISALLSVTRDITERKAAEEERRQLEDRLRHAQKLESLGILAGGIAHDFNNLLTAMLGNAGLALMNLPEGAPAVPMLREIEKAGQRAADLIQQMLAYSGRGKFVIQEVHLDKLVHEMTELLGSVVSRKATLQLNLDPAVVEGDATQLRQVLMNLITNASDALDGQCGTIDVRTGAAAADVAYLRSAFVAEDLPAGRYAYLKVSDTGGGMSAETLTRIFDPFFTTKFTGRGLGLAAVLGIVKGHHGTIKVASTPGQGTVFEVLLPCFAGRQRPRSAPLAQQPARRGRGTILVVEDEPQLRSLTRRVLQGAGFAVCEASDGRAGVDLFVAQQTSIVAVILDLTMPRMDGMEVLRDLRQLQATIPVLIMSGYSEVEIAPRLAGMALTGFIQKPFLPADLLRCLWQLPPAPL